jgi:hypothetical protein
VNESDKDVTALAQPSGAAVGTYPVAETAPWGVASDGEAVWVTDYDNGVVAKIAQ